MLIFNKDIHKFVVHRIDDLEISPNGDGFKPQVVHRIDDLENIQRGSSNPIEFYHRSVDLEIILNQ